MLIFIFGLLGFLNHEVTQTSFQKLQQDTIINAKSDTTFRINRVLIIGNKVTRDVIILRELTLKPGDTISSSKINNVLLLDKRKIYNLRLYNTVVIRKLELYPGVLDLLVEVTERWFTFPTPIFDISDRNFNEWWQNYHHSLNRVNYGIRLDQRNVRGRNETLQLTGQFGFTRKLALSYKIPYIDKRQKQGLTLDMDYSEPKNLAYFTQDHKLLYLEGQKTLKVTRGISVTYSYRKSFYSTHALAVGFRNSHIADTINILNPNYFSGRTRMQYGLIAYSFNSDHRDVIQYPLKGFQFTGYAQKVGLGLGDKVNQWELNLTYARHMDMTNGFYLSNFSSMYVSSPTSQAYALYSALGYRKQFVRGYEVYVIEGSKFFLNKTTFKKRIFSRAWQLDYMPIPQFRYFPVAIYIKTYADWGYVQNYPYYEQKDLNARLSNTLLASAGAGFDLVMLYDAVFRLEYTFTRTGTHGFFFNLKKEF